MIKCTVEMTRCKLDRTYLEALSTAVVSVPKHSDDTDPAEVTALREEVRPVEFAPRHLDGALDQPVGARLVSAPPSTSKRYNVKSRKKKAEEEDKKTPVVHEKDAQM